MSPTYQQVHRALDKARGLASSHTCRCGAPAKDWAYQHNALMELREGGAVYSASPQDYEPMCRPCHAKLDDTEAKIAPKTRATQLKRLEDDPQFKLMKNAVAVQMTQDRVKKAASDPSFRERLLAGSLRGAATVAKVRRKCGGCDMVFHPVGIGKHQKSSGHTGWSTP